MYKRRYSLFFLLALSGVFFLSCQKEIDGSLAEGFASPDQQPKIGTTWTYRYYTYNQDGSLADSKFLTYRAKTEDTIAGEKWLNVVDVDKDTTVCKLQLKADGLYQYTNNTSSLFCKDPAFVGDVYNTYNAGFPDTFYVRGMKDTLSTGIGDIPLNYYEGYRSGLRIDLIWYNKNAWIVWKTLYQNRARVGFFWYKYSSMFLEQIVY